MTKYNKVAILLHWLIAVAIIGMFFLGWFMTDLPKEGAKAMSYDLFNWGIYTWQLAEEASPRTFYYNLHKSIGFTLVFFVVFRLYWRISHKPPAILASYKAWERKLATGAHHSLYALMILLPLSGLIMTLASKYGLKWFGLKVFGGLDNTPLREAFAEVHEIIGVVILLILALHIAGALKHAIIDKDGTLKRMSFFK